MPTLSVFPPSGSSSVYSPSGPLHTVSQPSGSFSLSSSSRNCCSIYNNNRVSETRQRSRSRSPVLVARESSSRVMGLFRHYASNVVESASDSVPVPVSDRLRPNIPPLQFAAHEFLPEVAASAAAVAQYRQLRVRRALGVLPSSLILVPGAVSQRRGNHPPAPSGLQGGPIAAPFSIASGGGSASGSGGGNRGISGEISGGGRAAMGPARRGFETRPPQKPPNSRESNKSYEIITKLQIKTLQERPILQTAFWPAANITNSGLAADSGPCCGYKLGGYVHTSAPAPIGSGRVAHSSVHAQYESCRNIGVRRCDKYQTNEAVDTTAEGVEIYELAAKAGPEHVEERACDHCDNFP